MDVNRILNIFTELLFIIGGVLFILGYGWDGEICMLISIYLLLHKRITLNR